MKIGMLTPTFYPLIGGLELNVLELSKALSQRGLEISVLTTDVMHTGPLRRTTRKEQVLDTVRISRFPCYGFLYTYLPVSPSLVSHLFSSAINDFDVIHTHALGYVTSDMATIAGKIKRIPVVLTTHGHHQELGQYSYYKHMLWNVYRNSAIRFTLKKVDGVIAITEAELSYLKKFGDDIVHKTHVIPNGINFEQFKIPVDVSDVKRRYNLEGFIISYLGRIAPDKGLQYLVKAGSLLKNFGVTFLIIGPKSDYYLYLAKLASKFGVKARFTGFVNEKEKVRLLKASDVFCMPSTYEAFSVAIAEAMAAGKPIVATNVGGVPFVVKDKVNGFLVKYGDANALFKALDILLSDSSLRQKMGRASLILSREFSWEKIAEQTEKVYKQICS